MTTEEAYNIKRNKKNFKAKDQMRAFAEIMKFGMPGAGDSVKLEHIAEGLSILLSAYADRLEEESSAK